MNRRVALLAAGTAAAAIGLALAFVPSLAAGLTLTEDVTLFVALAAVAAGLYRGRTFLRGEADEYRPPSPERGRPVAVPGDEFDDTLAQVPRTRVAGDQRWLVVRDRLREAAVDALTQYRGAAPDEAEAMLDAGEWTDDRLAAEFFATPDGTGRSLRESVVTSLGGGSPFRRRAERASMEIYRIARGEEP